MTLATYLASPWLWALATFPLFTPEPLYRRGKGGRFERAN